MLFKQNRTESISAKKGAGGGQLPQTEKRY